MKPFIVAMAFFLSVQASAKICAGEITVDHIGSQYEQPASLFFSSKTQASYVGPHRLLGYEEGEEIELNFRYFASGWYLAYVKEELPRSNLPHTFYYKPKRHNAIELRYQDPYGYLAKGDMPCDSADW